MNTTLTVLWKHSADQHEPCLFCSDTKQSFRELLAGLTPVFRTEGIACEFREELVTAVPKGSVNIVELNAIPLDLLLFRAAEGEEYCHASRCMPARDLYRRVPGHDGIPCGEAPESLYRKAILLALEETAAGES